MRKYRRTRELTSQGQAMKKRIAGTRRRAKWVGTLYLLATIAFVALALLPLLENALAPVGVIMTDAPFYKTFLNLDFSSAEGRIKLACSALYAVMLLTVVINAFKALSRIGWLYKTSGNKTYGFNRNVYALDDLGRYFSGSFAIIFNTYLLIAVLCGVKLIDKADIMGNLYLLIAIGAGTVIHLIGGFCGCKIGYYDYEDNTIIEERRVEGRFGPLFRNFLQIGTVLALILFLDFANLGANVKSLVGGDIAAVTGDMNALLVFVGEMLVVLSLLVLITHATNVTEYSFEGVNAKGMKNFRVFVFFAFVGAALALAVKYLLVKSGMDKDLLIMAAVALVMFIVEIIMRKCPAHPTDKAEWKVEKKANKAAKKEAKATKKANRIAKKLEGEFTFDNIARDLKYDIQQINK